MCPAQTPAHTDPRQYISILAGVIFGDVKPSFGVLYDKETTGLRPPVEGVRTWFNTEVQVIPTEAHAANSLLWIKTKGLCNILT